MYYACVAVSCLCACVTPVWPIAIQTTRRLRDQPCVHMVNRFIAEGWPWVPANVREMSEESDMDKRGRMWGAFDEATSVFKTG